MSASAPWIREGAPPLVGRDLYAVSALLSRAGLPAPRVRLVEGAPPRGRVLAQEPAPGERWDPHIPLSLTVVQDNPIDHLPEVLREDDEAETDSVGHSRPRGFLRGMLLLTQHVMSGVEDQLVNAHTQLSPEGASPAMLSWLGERIPQVIEPHWSEDRVREVLRRAPELAARRGTAAGLAEVIALRTGIEARVVENAWPHGGLIAGLHRVGREATVATVPDLDAAFYVEVPEEAVADAGAMAHLLEVIDAEKPVHLRCCVVRRRPPPFDPLEGWDLTEEDLEEEVTDALPEGPRPDPRDEAAPLSFTTFELLRPPAPPAPAEPEALAPAAPEEPEALAPAAPPDAALPPEAAAPAEAAPPVDEELILDEAELPEEVALLEAAALPEAPPPTLDLSAREAIPEPALAGPEVPGATAEREAEALIPPGAQVFEVPAVEAEATYDLEIDDPTVGDLLEEVEEGPGIALGILRRRSADPDADDRLDLLDDPDTDDTLMRVLVEAIKGDTPESDS